MSRNVSDAAHGSGEIASNISGVAEAAQGTTRGASDTQKASQQLVETSTQLRRLVEQFRVNAGAGNVAGGRELTRSMAARAGA
jgi:methyl-accepting chemotaxis protein